jgi:hypothetical protein
VHKGHNEGWTCASELLEALRNPDRGFGAVVIGEPQRAFYGNQFSLIFPLFEHLGVELWVPEVGGPLDQNNEAHDLVMSVYGGMSKGERNRIKVRVRSAMAAQAAVEGRFLGGRPPYGHQLADAGPHPIPPRLRMASGFTGSNPTRPPRPSSNASTGSTSPDEARSQSRRA